MNSTFFDPFRSGRLVGFDTLFSDLDKMFETLTKQVSWPPYNIVKMTEDLYKVQFALAGFSPDDVSVTVVRP